MSKQEEFLSPKHKQLLRISTWVKYLAWGVLAFYILRAGVAYFQHRADLESLPNFALVFDWDPYTYHFSIISDIATNLLSGVVYYFVLNSIPLGLNMIVETDINYRERERKGMCNE